MRRKIACYIAVAVTALFMALRIVTATHPALSVGSWSLEDCLIGITLVAMAAIAVLCISNRSTLKNMNGVSLPFSGWVATFCGALLIMSVILDTFCWVMLGQMPPPNNVNLNNVDLNSVDLNSLVLVLSLVFGTVTGVFAILQGFNWMAGSAHNHKLLSWLSLAPVLWMWFRLARYEISYASTIDISHSFFDFASLVSGSLFFLQLARAITGVGAKPKNSLLIFALFTTIVSLSGAPLTFYSLAEGTPITSLLIALVDATVGLLALGIALVQTFRCDDETDETEEDGSMAWTDPEKERKPLDPPFSIDAKLPILDGRQDDDEATKIAQETPVSDKTDGMSVDDILAELNKDV